MKTKNKTPEIDVAQPASARKPAAPAKVDPEIAKMNARITLSTYSSTALIAEAYRSHGDVNVQVLQSEMLEQCKKIKEGKLYLVGTMLISQAHSLDVIFTNLALNASVNLHTNPGAAETYLQLALTAQNQCRATLETLAVVKASPGATKTLD